MKSKFCGYCGKKLNDDDFYDGACNKCVDKISKKENINLSNKK